MWRVPFFSVQFREVKDYNFILIDLEQQEMTLCYLVSATPGSYNSTDYLHFVAKRKEKESVHDLK